MRGVDEGVFRFQEKMIFLKMTSVVGPAVIAGSTCCIGY